MDTGLTARLAHLRLRDLMLLEHVAEAGSLTEVAARLHVTQSAVTQALQSLEEAFGRELVTRGRRGQRGVSLNAAGSAALMHLRVARHEVDAALAAAVDPDTLEVRIGALPLTLVRPLPDALARLRKRLPNVHVHLAEDTVPHLWQRLEAGEFDAIVCRLPAMSDSSAFPTAWRIAPSGTSRWFSCADGVIPLPGAATRRSRSCASSPGSCHPRARTHASRSQQLFLRAGLQGPRAAVTSQSFHAKLRLAAEGSLLAVAPRSAAVAERDVLNLVIHPLKASLPDTAVTLAWREASLGNRALVVLLECF